jgi:hypothetical protein
MKETSVTLHKDHWYERVPKSVETSQEGKVTILWNHKVQTDRIIPNNKPDIIIRDNERGTLLLDVENSGDGNVTKKESEKILKYKNLTTELVHVECKNKCDTINNRVNWNHLKIIDKIPEQHTGKA